MRDLTGTTLHGRYAILEILGEGGMARVYKARHLQLDRLVAVKIMLPHLTHDSSFAQRFEREARLVAQLHHPNIIQVYDFDSNADEQLYFMVIALLGGPSLAQRLALQAEQKQLLPLAETLRVARDLAGALAYAHNQKMIHRDIKPGNVMFDQARVVLTDFGLARAFDSQRADQLTANSMIVGTPAYISPEQVSGVPADPRSDLYSLGIMLYQMVTNRLPFQAETALGLLMQHVNAPVPAPSQYNEQLTPDLEAIILRLMAKAPDDRYPSADAFLSDLNAVNVEQDSRALKAVPTLVLPDPAANTTLIAATTLKATNNRGRFVVAAIGLIALLVLIAFGGIAVGKGGLLPTVLETKPSTSSIIGFVPTSTITPTMLNTVTLSSRSTFTAAITDSPTVSISLTTSATVTPTIHSCLAELTAAVALFLRTGAGDVFPLTRTEMRPGDKLAVTGTARSVSNQVWWQVKTLNGDGWVPGSEVTVSGACTNMPHVEVPTPTVAVQTSTRYANPSLVPPSLTPMTKSAATPTKPATLGPSATEKQTLGPSATEMPTIEPSATETSTLDLSVTQTSTLEPSTAEMPTIEPSATETSTLELSATETPTIELSAN